MSGLGLELGTTEATDQAPTLTDDLSEGFTRTSPVLAKPPQVLSKAIRALLPIQLSPLLPLRHRQPLFGVHSSKHVWFASSGAWSVLFSLPEAFPSLFTYQLLLVSQDLT